MYAIVSDLAISAFLVLLLLKTLEMLYHSVRLARLGGQIGHMAVTPRWPISQHLRAWVGRLFRLPVLVFATSALLWLLSATPPVLRAASLLLLLSIWMQIVQAFHSKFVLGAKDSEFRRLSVRTDHAPVRTDAPTPVPDVVKFIGGLVVTAIVAYAGAYYVEIQLNPAAFTGMGGMPDALYFSVLTFATVGYGDIKPEGTWPRLLCASEIIAGISIIGLFVLAYSLDPPDSTT